MGLTPSNQKCVGSVCRARDGGEKYLYLMKARDEMPSMLSDWLNLLTFCGRGIIGPEEGRLRGSALNVCISSIG